MNPLILVTLLLTLVLAGVNGGNDVSKGVATLAGAGITRYRTAILWGAATTLLGSLLSLTLAARMVSLFSTGIVAAPPTPSFTVAVLLGAIAWVGIATLTRLPVSTTHAIVGALIGAGIQLAPGAIHWGVLFGGVAVPLLASVAISYLLSTTGLGLLSVAVPECICVGVMASSPITVDTSSAAAVTSGVSLPVIDVTTGTETACRVHRRNATRFGITVTRAHWLTSGTTSFARGLNDTPKIVAIGALGGPALGVDPWLLLIGVSIAMAVGGLLGGVRVARVLGEKVVHMSHTEGFKANVTTALLVGIGANLGLPMSTTHVATGAIAGVAGTKVVRLNQRLLRDFALVWTLTPLVAGLVAAGVLALVR